MSWLTVMCSYMRDSHHIYESLIQKKSSSSNHSIETNPIYWCLHALSPEQIITQMQLHSQIPPALRVWWTNNDEMVHRDKDKLLVNWCLDKNLYLIISKTKELVVDFQRQAVVHTPFTSEEMQYRGVSSFRFLGDILTDVLKWTKHTAAVTNKNDFLRHLIKAWTSITLH